MDLQPDALGYTLFCKAQCDMCDKAKTLLCNKALPFRALACDEFLVGDLRAAFLERARSLMGVGAEAPVRFPLIFHNGSYVGGYQALVRYVEDVEDW